MLVKQVLQSSYQWLLVCFDANCWLHHTSVLYVMFSHKLFSCIDLGFFVAGAHTYP